MVLQNDSTAVKVSRISGYGLHEALIMRRMQSLHQCFPRVIDVALHHIDVTLNHEILAMDFDNTRRYAFVYMELYQPINKMNMDGAVTSMNTLLTQIMSALDALHAQKILHLDIGWDNIMWDPNGRVFKLIDFSLSKEIKSDGMRTVDERSPLYKPFSRPPQLMAFNKKTKLRQPCPDDDKYALVTAIFNYISRYQIDYPKLHQSMHEQHTIDLLVTLSDMSNWGIDVTTDDCVQCIPLSNTATNWLVELLDMYVRPALPNATNVSLAMDTDPDVPKTSSMTDLFTGLPEAMIDAYMAHMLLLMLKVACMSETISAIVHAWQHAAQVFCRALTIPDIMQFIGDVSLGNDYRLLHIAMASVMLVMKLTFFDIHDTRVLIYTHTNGRLHSTLSDPTEDDIHTATIYLINHAHIFSDIATCPHTHCHIPSENFMQWLREHIEMAQVNMPPLSGNRLARYQFVANYVRNPVA